ncbi:hypothetical protein O4H61_18405, partial [Roseovarius aestuarii]|nr:hypothetical protein [Roseovarius aestuarii]
TLNNLRHSVLFELVCKPYSFGHIRLSLVPKLPSKPSTNLGAPQPLELQESENEVIARPDSYNQIW